MTSINIQSDCKTMRKKWIDLSVCLHTVEKYEMIPQTSQKWTDKKKTNLFCEFCKSV